jgi:2-keto-4-pentenoate hydratase/2-oxohepta-3-ene-1,7-dioic acid hydratase in catechol pathway
MRLCTFQIGKKTTAGVVRGKKVFDLAQCFFKSFKRPFKFPDVLSFLQAGGMDRIGDVKFDILRDDRTCAHDARGVLPRAPILRPPKIIGVGLNYRDHAEEQGADLPGHPLLFSVAPNATIGPGEEIVIPAEESEQIDYEVELGVVIGREAFRVKEEDALEHVLGYTVVNDVTARDIQKGDKQWFRGKSFATFMPQGPVIVTRDEMDASSVDLALRLNGKTMQEGSTSNLIFDIPALIEFASAFVPLEVGDLISTGTPAGVGFARKPPVWLKSGDVVEARIDGIGGLENPVR